MSGFGIGSTLRRQRAVVGKSGFWQQAFQERGCKLLHCRSSAQQRQAAVSIKAFLRVTPKLNPRPVNLQQV